MPEMSLRIISQCFKPTTLVANEDLVIFRGRRYCLVHKTYNLGIFLRLSGDFAGWKGKMEYESGSKLKAVVSFLKPHSSPARYPVNGGLLASYFNVPTSRHVHAPDISRTSGRI